MRGYQLLPPEAFATVDEVIAATTDGDPFAISLPIICISYPWLTRDHPDPYGENLALIGKALRLMLAEEKKRCPRYFVLWEYTAAATPTVVLRSLSDRPAFESLARQFREPAPAPGPAGEWRRAPRVGGPSL